MTREEAIKVLKNTVDNIKYDTKREEIYFTHEWVGAYEMAIFALMEQPRWISGEERLPDDSRCVLVCHRNGYVTTNNWFIGSCRYPNEIKPITHLMPLHEPTSED